MLTRYTAGPLGKGWAHNWQMSIQEEADGTVNFNYMNGRLHYLKNSLGGYISPAGNYTSLAKAGDVFILTMPDGTKIAFNADGTFHSIEDLNRNRITAEYSGEQLSRLVHSSGQYLTLQYAGDKIQAVTDNTGELSVHYTPIWVTIWSRARM